jgi:hypothetical protein
VDRAEPGAAFPDVTGGLAWKLARLRSMSPAEVVWRIEERLSLARLEARSGRGAPPLERPAPGFLAAFRESSAPIRPPGTRETFATRLAALAPGERERLAAEAAVVRAGQIELFARRYALGPDPARWPWNRSPDGGPEVPLDFGPTLDYRDPARVGNARLAWELARATWSAAPAMAAYLGVDEEANAHFVVEAFEAFDRACPPLRGLQWSSGLELALRSLSWGWALALVAPLPAAEAIAEERWQKLFSSWAEAMRFVDAHDSRHSSANNHRLGEAAGLAWAGYALSFLPEANGWRRRGLQRLEDSFLAQTSEDGITREHAFAYQQFVLDFVVTVEAVARRSGRAVPAAIVNRIQEVALALDALSPRRAEVWAVGDGDEGRALHLAEPWEERVKASLVAGFGLVGTPDEAPVHPRAVWLGTDDEALAFETRGGTAERPEMAEAQLFFGSDREAEYLVERTTWSGREARLLFDAAPLGLAPLYAHGHADALMVLLDLDGPRLVDPGTGAYHSDPELRNRLRATSAHNTVEIDARSQSRPGGLFQWFDPAPIGPGRIRGIGDHEHAAFHLGYARGGERILHLRAVRCEEQGFIAVSDRICGAEREANTQAHWVVARWHVGDGVPTMQPGLPGHARVRWPDGVELTVAGFVGEEPSLALGAPAVWAPRFLEPRPCGLLEVAVEARLPLRMLTVIALGAAVVEHEERGGKTHWRVRTSRGDVDLNVPDLAPESWDE